MVRVVQRALLAIVVAALAACAGTVSNEPPPSKSFFIFFAMDSAELMSEATEVIERIAGEAKRIEATGVGIVGYASPAGTPSHNLRLSEQRSAAVEEALLARGVPRDVLVRTFHGATPVIGPEIEGQRVEVVVSREKR